jgi:microcin C transport system substrate-binding protein
MRFFLVLAFSLALAGPALAEQPSIGVAIYGQPKYAAGFDHFDYVNPAAPKGGELHLANSGQMGTFDSFNPFIVKGLPPLANGASISFIDLIGLTFDTLMVGSADEPGSAYGLVAESVEVASDRSWEVFNLRPQARFHDGSPITADDVVFSFDILREKGSPGFRAYFQNVIRAEKLADRKVRFVFAGSGNRELPVIMGSLPVLSKTYWHGRDFDKTTLEPPLGSGPYKVATFEQGRYIVLNRVADYWGKDLPVNKGLYNFDRIRTDYYRDPTAAFEAFKAGEYDLRSENESKKWATAYDFPAIAQGLVIKRAFPNHRAESMQGFIYNLRRPLFADPRVRRALIDAFDFEWSNKNLFYGQYTRTNSYFANSELASSGVPTGEEKALLDPYRDQLPAALFTQPYTLPVTDGNGNPRDNLRAAAELLRQAGWEVRDGKLSKDGHPFAFEILLDDPAWERICLPFVENLKRLGIEATIRFVDSANYKNRTDGFDFDMTVVHWPGTESPGNEQRDLRGSASADRPGSANLNGVKSPVVDALIEKLVDSPDRATLVTRTHALDRVLLWGDYVIPQWYKADDRVAYWDKFGMPSVIPDQGVQLFAWWIDPAKKR